LALPVTIAVVDIDDVEVPGNDEVAYIAASRCEFFLLIQRRVLIREFAVQIAQFGLL